MSKTVVHPVLLFVLLALGLAGCGGGGASSNPSQPRVKLVIYPDSVPDQYLATLDDKAYQAPTDTSEGDTGTVAADLCAKYGATLGDVFSGLGIFAFSAGDVRVAAAMCRDSRIDTVESDAIITGDFARKKRARTP